MKYVVWILMALFCLNRLLFWVLVLLWEDRSDKVRGTILYIVVGLTDLFWFLMPMFPQSRLQTLPLFWRIVGLVLAVVGITIMRSGSREFSKNNVSIRPDRTPSKLVTEGAYSKVRHPLYVGITIVFLGWSLVWVAVHSLYFVPVFIALNVLNAFFEEKYILSKAFPDEHRAYRAKVGMFIPKIGS